MKAENYNDMEKEPYRVAYLIAGYIRNTLTETEHDELDDWVNASDHNMKLFEDLTDEDNIHSNLEWMDKVQTEQSYIALQEKGAFSNPANHLKLRTVWIAAASVVLITGVFLLFRAFNKTDEPKNVIAASDTTLLKPGGNRAILTIGNEKVIDLATTVNGLIDSGKGSHVNKPADGDLVYEATGFKSETVVTHTLSTPVGGQYKVTLGDGTKVWLNAATTLKYPSGFAQNERIVEVNGEAYFEVARDNQKRFKVVLNDSSIITVSGTHFNVLAYSNQPQKEVALLEGSVSVTKGSTVKLLLPGMQANIFNAEIKLQDKIDAEELVGWKDGLFVFHDASIEQIMKQIERWYDAEVIYTTEIKQLFNGTILRSEPLSKVLRLLELNGYVHFKTENKKIYVLP